MQEDFRRLVDVRKIGDEVSVTINCSASELFGVIQELTKQLSGASNGELTYNQILEDLKETTEGEK